jgi:hypothetical protein
MLPPAQKETRVMIAPRNAFFILAVAAAIVTGPATTAGAASVDQAFSNAVARVLAGVKNDFLDGLTAAEKREFVACAQRIMKSAPLARKQYVLAAKNTAEMRQRFDEVALDNRAKLKQQISSECAA